jgi:hypothetical protein
MLPNNFFKNLREVMKILDFSEKDVRRRINALEKIYHWVEKTTREKYPKFPKKPYEYYFKKFYQLKNECYVQKMARKLSVSMNDNERQELEGQLCLILVSKSSQLRKMKKKLF